MSKAEQDALVDEALNAVAVIANRGDLCTRDMLDLMEDRFTVWIDKEAEA